MSCCGGYSDRNESLIFIIIGILIFLTGFSYTVIGVTILPTISNTTSEIVTILTALGLISGLILLFSFFLTSLNEGIKIW